MDEFDRNFDDILQESIPPLPPEAVARAVGPWKQAMTRILWGFGLCNVTFAFFGLQYILPAIGVLLTLLGFRALRGENKWFRICYYFSVCIIKIFCYSHKNWQRNCCTNCLFAISFYLPVFFNLNTSTALRHIKSS